MNLKQYVCCILLGLTSINLKGQEIFSKVYDSIRVYDAFNLDIGYIAFGASWNSSKEFGLILSVDDEGNFLWAKNIEDSSSNLTLTKTIRLKNKQFLSIGAAFNPLNFTSYNFIIKTDSIGNVIAIKKIMPSDSIGVFDVIESSNGNLTFCGGINYGNIPPLAINDRRFIVFQSDSNLQLIWGKMYSGKCEAGFNVITETINSNFVLQGMFTDTINYQNVPFNPFRRDIIVATLDKLGNIVWFKRIGNPLFPTIPSYGKGVCQAGKVDVFDNGEILNVFSTQWYPTQFTNGKDDVILQQLDSMGNELYSTRFGDETYGSQTFNTLTFDERNIVFDAGQFLIKCDSLFQIQWVNSMAQANGYALSYPLEAIIKSNNDTGFIGFLPLWKSNSAHLCLFKTDSLGHSNCLNLAVPFFTSPEIVGSDEITNDLITDTLLASLDSTIQFYSSSYFTSNSIICKTSTGKLDSNLEIGIQVQPTLVLENFFIKVSDVTSKWKFEVLNLNGNIIMSENIRCDNQSVDLSQFAKGMYIVKVFNENSQLYVKIVKL